MLNLAEPRAELKDTQEGNLRRVRVLFVLIRLEKNGAVLNALSIMRQLDQARFEPVLFLAQRSNFGPYWHPLLRGINVIYGTRAGRWTRHLHRVLPRLLSAARGADVAVGALEASATYLAVFGAKLTGKPSLGLVQNSLPSHLRRMSFVHRQLLKKTYPHLTLAVGVSAGVKGEVEALVPELYNRVRTSYNLIDVAEVRAASREPLPAAAPARPFILAAGRLVHQKGFDLLVRAYAALKGSKPDLVILGDGPERAHLEGLARTLGVAEQVSFAGFQDNPYAWMGKCEVFVSSSRYEGFCRVIAEALAVGVPVIATDCPSGPAEILKGNYGVLVPTEDAKALFERNRVTLKRQRTFRKTPGTQLGARRRLRCQVGAQL